MPILPIMSTQKENQESMLRESIKLFLTSYQNGSFDFSSFESIFFRLIQTMLDPPLEITWFYSAVRFHGAKCSSDDPSSRVVIAKDLLKLLMSCSNLSSPSKKIAMVAPVVYELYNIVCDCRNYSVGLRLEVEKLVDNMTDYVVMCVGLYDNGNVVDEFDDMVVCFEDLVRVWMADRGGVSSNIWEISRVFFPFLTDGIWKGISAKCGVRELCGIVLCEVFYLRVYWSLGSGMCTEGLLKDTLIQTMKGFNNFYFLDMLLETLVEPSLPVAAMLSYVDEVLLRKALYDAVMAEYSFYSTRWVQLADSHSKKLALLWVLVADHSIQFARTMADQDRAISYLKIFSESQFVSELIKWSSTQAGTVEQNIKAEVFTPKTFIKWLLVLDDQGLKLFDHSASMLHIKELMVKATVENEPRQLELVRHGFDQEMDDFSNYGFLGKKRKQALSDLQDTSKLKHAKCDFHGNSVMGKFWNDNGGIESDDLASQDDMELVG